MRAAISTSDNPFNPFKQFDEWFNFDCQMGYYSCNVLARFDRSTADLGEEEEYFMTEQAIKSVQEYVSTGTDAKFIMVTDG